MFSVFVSLLSASYAINSFFRWEKCLDAKRNGQSCCWLIAFGNWLPSFGLKNNFLKIFLKLSAISQ